MDQDIDTNQTKFEFSFDLARSKKDINNKMFFTKDSYLLKNHYANIKFANEPTLNDLAKFIENLKGLKMVLHAPEQSIFAKHLTSCLASWNTDISHVPVAKRSNMDQVATSTTAETVTPSSSCASSTATTPLVDVTNDVIVPPTPVMPRQPSTPPVPSPAIEEEHIHSIPPAFILIDDDIATLENKLAEFRSQPAASANVLQAHHGGRRAAHHLHHHQHKKSSSTILPTPQNFFHQGTTAIIHFTSLTKYKAVRDTIQCYAFLPSRDPFSMPRVVVVPKPAGPRRFLTALHTAWHNSVVEPHFSAIATSPSSPMPPVISMLVQREMAAAVAASNSNVTSPNEANSRVSPNDVSPGRRTGAGSSGNRPLSGLFSPPPPNGDNYFTSQQQQEQQHQQISPSIPCSNSVNSATASTTASNVTGNTRRRSANNTINATEQDYLTAKTPLVNALGVVSTTLPASAIAAASIAAAAAAAGFENEAAINSNSSGVSSNTLDTTNTESPNAILPVENAATSGITSANVTNSQEQSTTPIDAAINPTTSIDTATTAEQQRPKKKLSKTMTNFKLNKKKRKAKGTPFTDVVSPPINVLIVEGKYSCNINSHNTVLTFILIL